MWSGSSPLCFRLRRVHLLRWMHRRAAKVDEKLLPRVDRVPRKLIPRPQVVRVNRVRAGNIPQRVTSLHAARRDR
jgi:hypothetical protein